MTTLSELHAEIKQCTACDLRKGCKQVVPGVGPDAPRIMLIGEGPGANEDVKGEPFVGQAGMFLNTLLALAGLQRGDVYITNVVKCRPPQNRDPFPAELEACKPWLDRQMALLKPQVVVTLGRFSMARWFPGASISKIHGQPRKFGSLLVVPMFHPAAALHQPKYKELIEADFRQLPQILASTQPAAPPKKDDDPKQLSMF
ncbi:MAG: uracil-DNA glycosylase [Chloroflexi bacterium]|nr:uracil-DNA glycosylase [Chloroflexota bacterium]